MGTWLFLLFSTFFVLMIISQESVGDEDRPCLSWTCARKRALAQAGAGRINSRREKQLQKMYDALKAHNEIKKSRVENANEVTPCLSWHCRRKRREVAPTSRQPTAEDTPCLTPDCRVGKRREMAPTSRQPTAEDTPCLTEDCRVGKRSKVGPNALGQKLRFNGQSEENGPGCLSWHCQGGKRSSMDQSYNVKEFTRDWSE